MSHRAAIRVSTLTFVTALKRLMDGPASSNDIEEATGLHKETVWRLMRAMVQLGTAHVSDMGPDVRGRRSVRIYTLGPAPKKV